MVRSLRVVPLYECGIHILWLFTGHYGEEFVSERKEKLGVIELLGTQ